MTLEDLLPQLDAVRPSSRGFLASCPAHDDRHPSLSISAGQRGILVKCWAGCSLMAICERLGIEQRDLFFDDLDLNPSRQRAAALQRERARQYREQQAEQQGLLVDALREADYFIRSRSGIDISTWSDQKLDDELSALADAYVLIESEDLHG
jgi:hypothetical protein